MRIHVDQTKELACLANAVNAIEDNHRIVLLHGDRYSGKTAFLENAYTLYEEVTAIAWLDFNQVSDPLELIDNIANEFSSQDVALERYFAALEEQQHIYVTLAHNRLKESAVDVSVQTSDARADRARELLGRMLDDLDKWAGPPRRLILLDNYEEASPGLSRWLQGTFLPRIAYCRSTVCVITGSHPPDPPSPPVLRKTARLTLKPLEEGDIKEWLIAAGLAGDDHHASYVWQGTQGIPGQAAIFIANLVSARVVGAE
jgi:hypothetical protein